MIRCALCILRDLAGLGSRGCERLPGVQEMSRVELTAPGSGSLLWHVGALVDVAAGWRRYPLDGSAPVSRYTGYGPGFDAAVIAPAADVVALVRSTGTKALLLEPGGKVIRELNRS
jgi:hypothetical protein